MSNKIEIDLDAFKGKNINDLKIHIYNELNKIQIRTPMYGPNQNKLNPFEPIFHGYDLTQESDKRIIGDIKYSSPS